MRPPCPSFHDHELVPLLLSPYKAAKHGRVLRAPLPPGGVRVTCVRCCKAYVVAGPISRLSEAASKAA